MATIGYMIVASLGYLGIVIAIRYFRIRPLQRHPLINFLVGFGFTSIILKLTLTVAFLLVGIVSLGLLTAYDILPDWFDIFQITIVVLIGVFPFLGSIYGIIFGKYRFTAEHVTLSFPDLPPAFDGLKMIQISDVHSGTWDSIKGVKKGIDLIAKQDADVLVFTGDLVNADKDEIDPFIDLFASLKFPMGKFAVLGNHDYYGQPREREHREAYYLDFFNKYERMGFDLINNEHRTLSKNGDQLQIVGVENWGSGRYFPKRGDLDQACAGINNSDFKILLSHDPSHWELKALDHPMHFHLTLSGHTHGMQFGINLPFFKWSPVQYRYKQWMGLYTKKAQHLYVNRGFGLLAFPGRVGMSPEVTVITFKRKSATT